MNISLAQIFIDGFEKSYDRKNRIKNNKPGI
jgi:hypothetical protein